MPVPRGPCRRLCSGDPQTYPIAKLLSPWRPDWSACDSQQLAPAHRERSNLQVVRLILALNMCMCWEVRNSQSQPADTSPSTALMRFGTGFTLLVPG